MKRNFRNPPIQEITITRWSLVLKFADAAFAVAVLIAGGFTIAIIIAALVLR